MHTNLSMQNRKDWTRHPGGREEAQEPPVQIGEAQEQVKSKGPLATRTCELKEREGAERSRLRSE